MVFIQNSLSTPVPVSDWFFNIFSANHWNAKNGIGEKEFFSPKNGKKDYIEAKKFRPKTLLSVIGKLFELFIAARINWILSRNSALDDNQEGFRGGRGKSRMLYKIFSDIDGINYQTRLAVLVGIDLEKTFDSVDVDLMTKNLQTQQLLENLLNWFMIIFPPGLSAFKPVTTYRHRSVVNLA